MGNNSVMVLANIFMKLLIETVVQFEIINTLYLNKKKRKTTITIRKYYTKIVYKVI